MASEIRTALHQLLNRQSLETGTMRGVMGAMMSQQCTDVEIAAILTALLMKGETEEEIAGAALAMRERATRIPTSRTGLIDTCGTGGDGMKTFNISTATAFVIAASGVPVAKHGNRSVTSTSGSADVLEALGVDIDLSAEQAGACLDAIGICFCYARTLHTAMKHVAPVRAQLGFRTIFNLLGPLTNPAAAEYQLIGVSSDELAAKIAGAARSLDLKRVMVVCGNHELDEVALWGTTRVWDVTPGQVLLHEWTAADFGLPECSPRDLMIESKEDSARIIQGLVNGAPGPARNIVVANAALALVCRGAVSTLKEGVERAQSVIDDGQTAGLLKKLVDWTTEHGRK